MSHTALLELGTEDLPPETTRRLLDQLRRHAERLLDVYRLSRTDLEACGSSRRLVLLATGVPTQQAPHEHRDMGPPRHVVFDANGDLTPAGAKYLEARGAAVEDLGTTSTEKGEYVYIRRVDAGSPTVSVLPELFRELIGSLWCERSMHWGRGTFSFSRPIRWVCCFYGEQLVSGQLAGLPVMPCTRGHRYLAPRPITISSAETYEAAIAQNRVILRPDERRKIIQSQLRDAAKCLQEEHQEARILEDSELLEDMVYLTEHPTVFWGEFDFRFLSLPFPVLHVCLRSSQKQFTVTGADGPLPWFVGVRDGDQENLTAVVAGNRRVIHARMADAEFFFREDRKSSLAARLPRLKGVVVQERLGSYFDKARRLKELGKVLGRQVELSEQAMVQLERAALLCKTDLVTNMVREFPELEGTMGRIYAEHDGENPLVAQAIEEHRKPRVSGDSCPETPVGAALAVVDKVDTVVGAFWAGFIPSSSQDPWGLRREAQAILEICQRQAWPIALGELVEADVQLFGPKDDVSAELLGFFENRLVNYLKGQGVRADVVQAVTGGFWDDLGAVFTRCRALLQSMRRERFRDEVIAIVRILNILSHAADKGIVLNGEVRSDSLIEEAERVLYRAWNQQAPVVTKELDARRYAEAYQALVPLEKAIHGFFDQVLVMCEAEEVRRNRLALLQQIGEAARRIADFRQLNVK